MSYLRFNQKLPHAPYGWQAFERRHPTMAIQKIVEMDYTIENLETLDLLTNAISAFPYVKDERDQWDLKMPGDCEDYMISLRAMLNRVGFHLGSLQPAFCKREGVDHAVLLVWFKNQLRVCDPIWLDGSTNYQFYEHGITLSTDGEDWYTVRPEGR